MYGMNRIFCPGSGIGVFGNRNLLGCKRPGIAGVIFVKLWNCRDNVQFVMAISESGKSDAGKSFGRNSFTSWQNQQ